MSPDKSLRTCAANVKLMSARKRNTNFYAYDTVDLSVLWAVYADDLDPLERAVDAMLAAHPPMEGSL